MSKVIRSKLHRQIETELKATGLPWSIERGRRHRIVMLAGKQIAVFSEGASDESAGRMTNMRGIIKRAVEASQKEGN